MKHILPFLTVAMLLAACTQDELTDNTMLPEGMYPLEIASVTLSVEGGEAQPWGAKAPQTRVSENTGGTGSVFMPNDAITVSLGGETAAYTYDGNTWTSTAPLYWQNTQQATVNAWYPANGTVNLANLSSGLAYVLKGTGEGSYQTGVNLTFTHQLAKVRVELEGEKASDVTGVEIFSYTTCTHNQGTISTDGASQDWITMHQADYNGTKYWEANVVPGTITADKFIRLNGSSEATVTGITDLAAGSMYTVNLNVKSPVVPDDAKEITGSINDDGNYVVSGTRSEAINITGGSPHIYLDEATVSVSSGSAISITGNATPTIHVVGTSSLANTADISANGGAGIFVAVGSSVIITSADKNTNSLTVTGYHGAGIGGVAANIYATGIPCGDITIENVTVIATSNARYGYQPGIGGSGAATCGTITITNAIVHATGRNDASYVGAPAIGSGLDESFNKGQIPTIQITDSDIHAHKGSYSDYIGMGGDRNGYTGGAIQFGTGGYCRNSTVYCYTGTSTTTDKVMVYDANGTGTEQSQ